MIRIPITPGIREQRVVVTLGTRTYVVRTEWLERVGGWYLHLATAQDEPIATGLRIFGAGYLLLGLADDRRPDGQILSVSNSDPDTPPGFSDLGTRTQLLFATNDELLEGVA